MVMVLAAVPGGSAVAAVTRGMITAIRAVGSSGRGVDTGSVKCGKIIEVVG
jgi:hypothetical protein